VVIAAAGAAPHQIIIESSSTINSNDVEWVMMADSWQYDEVAQRLMNVRPMYFPKYTTSIEKLQQPDQDFVKNVVTRTAYDIWHHVPASVDNLDNTSRKLARSIEPLLTKVPRRVTPLGVVLHGVDIAGNVVEGGLFWLRLVNTTISNSTVQNNTGGKLHNSSSKGRVPSRAGYLAVNQLEGAGSACDPPVFDALFRVVGPMPFIMSRYGPSFKPNITQVGPGLQKVLCVLMCCQPGYLRQYY
jgi:hypothetical protein